jgi:hypothetical protein
LIVLLRVHCVVSQIYLASPHDTIGLPSGSSSLARRSLGCRSESTFAHFNPLLAGRVCGCLHSAASICVLVLRPHCHTSEPPCTAQTGDGRLCLRCGGLGKFQPRDPKSSPPVSERRPCIDLLRGTKALTVSVSLIYRYTGPSNLRRRPAHDMAVCSLACTAHVANPRSVHTKLFQEEDTWQQILRRASRP